MSHENFHPDGTKPLLTVPWSKGQESLVYAKYLVQRILWHTVSSWYKRRQQGGGAKKKRMEEEMLWGRKTERV